MKNIRPIATELFFLPVETRVPFKFGSETLTNVTCARVRVSIEGADGSIAEGWGETPLNVQWAWPSNLSYSERDRAMAEFCREIASTWCGMGEAKPFFDFANDFLEETLPQLLAEFNAKRGNACMPELAALVCASAFDLALYDAVGNLNDVPVFELFTERFMAKDLSHYLEPAAGSTRSFSGQFPSDFLTAPVESHLTACHLVGGKDLLEDDERKGTEPDDGYPVTLRDWITQDGHRFLKIKLCGTDSVWDTERIVQVGQIAMEQGVDWLTCDFNCTVTDPSYVNQILDTLKDEHPRLYGMILYVEQPFPYDLEGTRIDVHSVSSRKPLFMDESAHDWRRVRLGFQLGWNGVALKTCKTLTGAILSLCWARAHGMSLMVQDLTNPMLAQIPHVLLAAHAGTIMGVETNAMQFYPEASIPEMKVHPGLYQRREGQVDFSSISGSGFGYRLNEINRQLPEPAASFKVKQPTSGV